MPNAYLAGLQLGQQAQAHAQQLEENKLRMMVLRHSIDGLKLQDQLRARELAEQHLKLLHGQPAADLPSEDVTTPGTPPAQNLAGVLSNVFQARNVEGAPIPQAPMPAPDQTGGNAASVLGTPGMTLRRPLPVQIPGIPAAGVPGASIRPQSLEDLFRAETLRKLAEPYDLAPEHQHMVGSTVVATGGPAERSVGAGGAGHVDPITRQWVQDVPGRPTAAQRPIVVNGRVVDPNDP